MYPDKQGLGAEFQCETCLLFQGLAEGRQISGSFHETINGMVYKKQIAREAVSLILPKYFGKDLKVEMTPHSRAVREISLMGREVHHTRH